MQGFKILEIVAENHKALRALHLVLDGGNLHVAGKTAQGKTTAISALWEVLEKASEPITHGETRSKLRITLGNPQGKRIFAERVTTPKTSTIKITTSEGESISAKEFRDWLHSLAVNPHHIMNLKPQERVSMLLGALGLGESLATLGAKEEEARAERLLLRRQLDSAVKELGAEPPDAQPVDVSQVLHNRSEISNRLFSLNEVARKRDGFIEDAQRLYSEMQVLQARYTALSEKIEEGNRFLLGVDIKTLNTELATHDTILREAGAVNAAAVVRRGWESRSQTVDSLELLHAKAEDAVEAIVTEKKSLLDHAVFPIATMELREGELWFRGVPLTQCGSSEQLLACTALAAVLVSSSPVPVVRMDGVESMSAEDQAAAVAILNKAGCQVLTSRVSRDGKGEPGEVIITEGAVQDA